MGIINVLDFSVANLIAAGEVVDRPASVIKELLENSIDAGADDITVEIKRGGISFMRVSDNGKGIEKEDMPIAIKRHATSKIKDADDLNSIFTLGFRGEALAAIASVSKLRIMSKTPESEVGHILEAECGNVKSIVEAGCPQGTTIIVENLFENVPARLKFLKKDATEAMAVSAYVEKIALSRPDISIKLIIDGNMKFMTTGDSKLYSVMYILFGRDFVKKTLPIDSTFDGVRVWGYTATPDNIRANRNFQNFFINGRFVKSKTISAALEQAYSAFIPLDKFPCAVLNIDINPSTVDVNVHPAKLEVKFSNERLIFEAVYSTVRQALENNTQRPELKLYNNSDKQTHIDYTKKLNQFVPVKDVCASKNEQISFVSDAYKKNDQSINNIQNYEVKHSIVTAETDVHRQHITTDNTAIQENNVVESKFVISESYNIKSDETSYLPPIAKKQKTDGIKLSEQLESKDQNTVPEYRIIGEAFYSYVFVEVGESVLIIDKHAAHERIIFEELKKNLANKEVASQILLVPLDIVMADIEIAAISEYADEIKKTGFEFKIYGNTISITETPIELDIQGVVPMIQTVADRLANGTGNVALSRDMIYERALFQASCKAAVKIGHVHDSEHIKWICERVIALDIIKFCPHGRPVAFELKKHDFERQFKRT